MKSFSGRPKRFHTSLNLTFGPLDIGHLICENPERECRAHRNAVEIRTSRQPDYNQTNDGRPRQRYSDIAQQAIITPRAGVQREETHAYLYDPSHLPHPLPSTASVRSGVELSWRSIHATCPANCIVVGAELGKRSIGWRGFLQQSIHQHQHQHQARVVLPVSPFPCWVTFTIEATYRPIDPLIHSSFEHRRLVLAGCSSSKVPQHIGGPSCVWIVKREKEATDSATTHPSSFVVRCCSPDPLFSLSFALSRWRSSHHQFNSNQPLSSHNCVWCVCAWSREIETTSYRDPR